MAYMTTTIKSRFLRTFLYLTALYFLVLFIARSFFLDDFYNFQVYKYLAVLFSVLLTYFNVYPYILSFSLYRAFFYYENNGEASLLSVSQKTIIIATVSIVLYSTVLGFFSSSISRNIHNIYVSQEYMHLYKSKKDKSSEYLKLARQAFTEKDYDASINIIQEGLSLLPGDEDLIIFLKHVTTQKERDISILKNNTDVELERRLMTEAVDAYSDLNYEKAKTILAQVLDINSENGMAKFYLNKIALQLGEKNSLFTQENEAEIILYKKLSEAISFYNAEEYWAAYYIFRDIYVEHPYNFEVFDYYNLAMAKLKINDFFITDAEFLYDIFVSKNNSTPSERQNTKKNILYNMLSFPINYTSVCAIEFLRLSEEDYFYSTVLNIFNETYFFDVVLFSSERDTDSYTKYRYGKLVASQKEGEYHIVLKGKYDSDKSYSGNDLDYHIISVNVPPNLFAVAKHIDVMDFVSIVDMVTLLKYMPDFGFDKKELVSALMYKLFLPLEVLLIAVLISYYSMRYRMKHNVHIVHKIVGLFGSVFLTFMILEIYDLVINMLSIVWRNSYIGFIILGLITLVFAVGYGIQFFRVKIDDAE